MILLDTNVISEMMRLRPEPLVAAWLDKQPQEELWTASVVIAELLSGIELMSAGRKQRALREAVEEMIGEDFRGQVLKFDLFAARRYGQIFSSRRSTGRPIREMDALIAGTALANSATLATRNTPDFEDCGIQLVNPWQAV
ncbi:MAG: type II toxin-antitoxin system VapC family toxin [Terracidiphilus sp.]